MYFSAHKETTSMWTPMECNNMDHGQTRDHFSLFHDPIYGRKLRPLVPRPLCTATSAKSSLFSSGLQHSPCFCTHNPNILPWKHPLLGGMSSEHCGDHKRLISSMPLVSTRWNPTPEQLQALEEMYRRGTRTPSAEQIQQIAAKLRRFGKIEGKNVFYWFQNHKARERQKKRRQLELLASGKKIRSADITPETKPSGLSKRCFEIEHASKKVPTPSSCSSSTFSEGAECNKKDGWDRIIKTAGPKDEINCWKLELSSCIHPKTNSTVQTFTAQNRSSEQENADSFSGGDHTITLPRNHNNNDFKIIETSGIKGGQTLQLFPVIKSIDLEEMIHQQDHIAAAASVGGSSKFAPNQFIEFLPTKN